MTMGTQWPELTETSDMSISIDDEENSLDCASDQQITTTADHQLSYMSISLDD